MKKTIAAVMMMTCLGAGAFAQTRSVTRSSGQLAAESAQAATLLNATKQSGAVEAGRLETERQDDRKMALKAAQAAASLLAPRDAAEAATTKRADASMSAAMKHMSPEGRALLAQGDAAGATKAPDRPFSSAAQAPPPGPAPKPAPLKSMAAESPAAPGSRIIITCTGAVYFDSKTSVALFTENVEVRHPQFFVSCDEFEVHMVKEDKPKEGEPAAGAAADGKGKAGGKGKAPDPIKNPLAPTQPANPAPSAAAAPTAGASGDAMGESSIKFAIARGRMVTIEKLTENGEVQIGHSKHATYEGATGNITLRDFPQVQRGQHLQIATDPSTVMVLKQNGALDTKGPSRTEIIQQQEKKPARLNSAPPPPNASPNPGASPIQPTR